MVKIEASTEVIANVDLDPDALEQSRQRIHELEAMLEMATGEVKRLQVHARAHKGDGEVKVLRQMCVPGEEQSCTERVRVVSVDDAHPCHSSSLPPVASSSSSTRASVTNRISALPKSSWPSIGAPVGSAVGLAVGASVGIAVGAFVGAAVGAGVGVSVGASVGAAVIAVHS